MPDAAVRESRDRVKCAILNSGFEFPSLYFTINLAPGDTRKEGSLYDLPIAIGILCSSEQISSKNLNDCIFIGELSLNGDIRGVSGILPICHTLFGKGFKKVVLPKENADEAALIKGLKVIPVSSLKETIDYLNGTINLMPHEVDIENLFSKDQEFDFDFSEVKGQEHAKRALEIAAAGNHNILMVGPPGSGKTMLAKRLTTILPNLTIEESLEVTKLYSITGLINKNNALITKRPFRSPHHTTSNIGIIGGGRIPRPGEVSLAHFGTLFLDEFPEFERNVLEVLREPLEDNKVTVSRALASITYPASFMLIAAMNPCPCGNFTDLAKTCICSPQKVKKYWGKISSPLLDRIDIHIEVPSLKKEEMTSTNLEENSKTIRERVIKARTIQYQRYNGLKFYTNANIPPKHIKTFCELDKETKDFLKSAIINFKLSGRSYDRTIKLARTIADLESCQNIGLKHIAEALQYRTLSIQDSCL